MSLISTKSIVSGNTEITTTEAASITIVPRGTVTSLLVQRNPRFEFQIRSLKDSLMKRFKHLEDEFKGDTPLAAIDRKIQIVTRPNFPGAVNGAHVTNLHIIGLSDALVDPNSLERIYFDPYVKAMFRTASDVLGVPVSRKDITESTNPDHDPSFKTWVFSTEHNGPMRARFMVPVNGAWRIPANSMDD